ncbi:MAG: nucleotidyl transferase AbiEii/AbiGii toxin family protein [bacterium]|nr:nucleotidyl transferase AbiEii/AbiGii toxin family protein [bacterium]
MSLDTAAHRNILLQILKDIYTDSTIGPILGFKGGTAAYLFYTLNRFSMDLDFDLLDIGKQDYVFERVKKILAAYGELKQLDKKHHTLFYLLSYEHKIAGARNIKIEINLRDFGSKYEVRPPYLGISMKVMTPADMFAHKLVAMTERTTNRDVFDVHFFLKNNWPINEEIIKLRTEMSLKDFLKKCVQDLEAREHDDMLGGMGELLDEKQKAWVKTNLRTDTIFLLKLRL